MSDTFTDAHDQLIRTLRPLALGLRGLWEHTDGTRDLMMFEDQQGPGRLTEEGGVILNAAWSRASEEQESFIPLAQEAGGDLYDKSRTVRLLIAAAAGVEARHVSDHAETLFVVWEEADALYRHAIEERAAGGSMGA